MELEQQKKWDVTNIWIYSPTNIDMERPWENPRTWSTSRWRGRNSHFRMSPEPKNIGLDKALLTTKNKGELKNLQIKIYMRQCFCNPIFYKLCFMSNSCPPLWDDNIGDKIGGFYALHIWNQDESGTLASGQKDSNVNRIKYISGWWFEPSEKY